MSVSGTDAHGVPLASSDTPVNAAAAPGWLKPLIDGVAGVAQAYRRRVPADVLAAITAANDTAARAGTGRDAAVLVLFSGPPEAPVGGPPDALPPEADLLLTVRASTLRHHAGQAAFPGGAADPGDAGPVGTALREANEETGLDVSRLQPLLVLDRMFIPPSGFHVFPVLAYSPDPGPVGVTSESETAVVARVPLRAFINPANRLMVYRNGPVGDQARRFAGPAFLLDEMLVWGFTAQVISAVLEVAGWAEPWDGDDVRELDSAMRLVGGLSHYGEGQQ